MGDSTAIAWTDRTWNPWQGCHRISAGCIHCYMYREKIRHGQKPAVVVRSASATFNRPHRWQREAAADHGTDHVFVCSWSDFFIEEADWWRPEAWAIIRACPDLVFQIPTKRPGRIAACLPPDWGSGYPNVWLGITTENQHELERRWAVLRTVPSVAPRFFSVEPLLEAVLLPGGPVPEWLIVGCESGPFRRHMERHWARQLLQQCRKRSVRFFMKQMEIDREVTDRIEEFPAEFRVREFPTATNRHAT